MNTIHFSKKQELQPGKFVIPFSCSDIEGVRTFLRPAERKDYENQIIKQVWNRITLVLRKHGFEVQMVNFRNMAITATVCK